MGSRQSRGGNKVVGMSTGTLLGYLHEGLGDDIRILLQVRVADGHRRREKTDLERVGGCKHTTFVTVGAVWTRTKMRMVSAPSFQFSTFSLSNPWARVAYILKTAPEGHPGPARSHGDAMGRHGDDVGIVINKPLRCGFILYIATSALRWQYGVWRKIVSALHVVQGEPRQTSLQISCQ